MKERAIEHILKTTQLNKSATLEFLSIGIEKDISKNKLLSKPNITTDKAYFLTSGTIRHYIEQDSKQFTKNFIRGPRFMLPSLTSFFLETPSKIYCEALTPLNVIEWSRKDLFHFADEHPKMYNFFLKAVVRAFHTKELKEIAFVQLTAEQRYRQFLDDFPNLVNEIPIQYIETSDPMFPVLPVGALCSCPK